MSIVADSKRITADEKRQVAAQVQSDMVDHLYEGCLPGAVTGVGSSIAFYFMYHNYTPQAWLVTWMVVFNIMLGVLIGLYFFYVKNKPKYTSKRWLTMYSIVLMGCALMWVPCTLLMPEDTTRQFMAIIAVFMVATAYATGTIGQFLLCVATVSVIVSPLMIWSFLRGGLLYNLIGSYSLIYLAFIFGVNQRSTKWLKDSLKFKLESTMVSYQANHDVLTDLPNQRLLPGLIESAIQFLHEQNDIYAQQAFALVCFSLNRLEMINDSLGYEAGNAVIKAVADRLTALSKQAAQGPTGAQYIVTISRKDTFNILVAPLKLEEVEQRVRQLFSVVQDPIYLEQRAVTMTASLGVSIYPKDGDGPEHLLANAEAAMLQAKQFGINRLEFYRSEINAQSPKKLEIENDLYAALANNEFQVYYQPLVDAKTAKIVGSEALIRWAHPERGMISPAQFIPIAEETGLIVPIGEWVLQEACRQTKRWHQMGFDALRISVNLAGKQMQQENIIQVIENALSITQFDPRFLELELTETAMLDESIIGLLKQCKEMGLSLAVDDFGTGYSGLSYLKRFSIDKLKIDQSFIRDIPGNNDSITIVSAILAMAKEMNVITLAEGVETEEQYLFLKGKGCNYIQGYYFSKPLETSFFTQLLLNTGTALLKEDLVERV